MGDTDCICFFEHDSLLHSFNQFQNAMKFGRKSFVLEGESIEYVTLSKDLLTSSIPVLLEKDKVQIWTFNNTRKSWKCSVKASPGNYDALERWLDCEEPLDSPIICSCFIERVDGGNLKFSMVTIDLMNFSIGWCQITESIESGFPLFSLLLLQIAAKEVILSKVWEADLSQLLFTRHSSIIPTFVSSSSFSAVDGAGRLICGDFPAEWNPLLDKSFGCLVDYLELLRSCDENQGAFTIRSLSVEEFVLLDETAIAALSIFKSASKTTPNIHEWLSEHCKTKQGTKLIASWLRQPLKDKRQIASRQNLVHFFTKEIEVRQKLGDILRGIPDAARIFKKMQRSKGSIQDLTSLYFFVAKIQPFYALFEPFGGEHQDISSLLIYPIKGLSVGIVTFVEMVENTVDFEAMARHEYVVKSTFDPELERIRKEKDRVLDLIEQEFHGIANDLGLEVGKKIKLEISPVHGYYLRVGRGESRLVNGKRFIELSAQKNGFHFVNHEMRQLSLRHGDLTTKYNEIQQNMIVELVKVAISFKTAFFRFTAIVAMVDALQSMALVAALSPIPLVRPTFGGDKIKLISARHPLIECVGEMEFVPNDLFIDRDSTPLTLITGPNMGGKSTFIRQTAIIALLAQIGSFVPCESAELPIFDAFLIRLGAGDNLMRGWSTFMVEMQECSSILKRATKQSLVIIDELGRGTSTSEGFGIAWAICKYLYDLGCTTLFASHFQELTLIDFPIQNLHAEAILGADGQVKLSFHIKQGPCQASFGINVAKMAKFPDSVTRCSEILLQDLERAGGDDGEFGDGDYETAIQWLENPSHQAAIPPIIKRDLSEAEIMKMKGHSVK